MVLKKRVNNLLEVSDEGVLFEVSDNGKKEVSFGGVSSKIFVERLASELSATQSASNYSNEIFLYFILKQKEWQQQLVNIGLKNISVKRGGMYKSLWRNTVNKHYKMSSLFLLRDSIQSALMLFISLFIVICGSVLIIPYLIYRCCIESDIKPINNKIAIVRSPATYSKLHKISHSQGIELYSEDLIYKNESLPSMFSLVPIKKVMRRVFLIPYMTIKDFFFIVKEAKLSIGFSFLGHIAWYYKNRILIKVLYEVVFESICAQKSGGIIYTGNKEDRFAILEQTICNKYYIDIQCIPHGLEYSFKLPSGLAGNKFFTTSYLASSYLNNIYATKKFIYDENLTSQLYGCSGNVSINKSLEKIVYFSESRDTHVNIYIVKALQELKVPFYIKLHPKDSKSNYLVLDEPVNFIDDYHRAITNSLCIARKSTVLVEALYNNSKPIAFLVSSKDKYYTEHVFLSLQTELIEKAYDIKGLMEMIYKYSLGFHVKKLPIVMSFLTISPLTIIILRLLTNV